jgi:hypothetical protein
MISASSSRSANSLARKRRQSASLISAIGIRAKNGSRRLASRQRQSSTVLGASGFPPNSPLRRRRSHSEAYSWNVMFAAGLCGSGTGAS